MGESKFVSRRAFVGTMRWAPLVFLPAPLREQLLSLAAPNPTEFLPFVFPFTDSHLKPRYPSASPLEEVLALVSPSADSFLTEKYAFEIQSGLDVWSRALKVESPATDAMAKFLDAFIVASALTPSEEVRLPSGDGVETFERRFAPRSVRGRRDFLEELKRYLAAFRQMDTAQFEIVGIRKAGENPLSVEADIRYDFVGPLHGSGREERIGVWKTVWLQADPGTWRATHWEAREETLARVPTPLYVDVTAGALGHTLSFREQLLPGVDHWRAVLDGACNLDVYGNHGIAAGDFDNDGLDDLYVCQPSGLPNRLYHNRGDGTFEDVTEKSGVGVLDATACALFADFRNTGLQDLLVVTATGPLLFLNGGDGRFSLKQNAFRFSRPAQGTFTHAAVADYDRDGRLDVYFCLYSYYLGLDQYRYPSPYFDARNGPPNFLFHNEGNATFVDRTEVSGLHVENDRFSFACSWGDCDSNGWPDLYVANDFGRGNLYRNKGDGTFAAVSEEAHVNDVGAGMSACWADFHNDGNQDIYVSNMWSAAGQRIAEQSRFHAGEPESIRSLYQQHARGNSLYKNSGNGNFANVSRLAGVEMGRWAWSSDAWDFDHDGFPDLYVANGYVSGPDIEDISSFFWRQVVAKSPPSGLSSVPYERGWNAINELIRSGSTWSGFERNTFYRNNRNGTFSEISGVTGLDFIDDSRSFALADLDRDGRLELVLKNRNAPQVRVLHNAMAEIGDAVCFRLTGTKSNRDGIGAAVTVQSGTLRQTKYLQAGSGFLSQHSKELFFGLGKSESRVTATVRWPSGAVQAFEDLPRNHRIALEEGRPTFLATKFAPVPAPPSGPVAPSQREPSLSPIATWLLDPLAAPHFALPDLNGEARNLSSFRGKPLLLQFWVVASAECAEQLELLQRIRRPGNPQGLPILSINVDEAPDEASVRAFVAKHRISLPVLLATPDVAGVYNILYRYLFDRRKDLPLPTAFLVDEAGMVVKIYQGVFKPEQFMEDAAHIPQSEEERTRRALPFPGTLYSGRFQRNEFTYGVALFQRGYLDQAAAAFRQVVASKPSDPEAYYNLGTLYLRKSELSEARRFLEKSVALRPDYPEALNNLGMVAAQQDQPAEAIRNFERSLVLRPDYAIALLNLGNIYRRQGAVSEAAKLLERALELEPENPEANYSVGMLYAGQQDFTRAAELLRKAARIRPDYPDAWNNLGVLFARQGRNAEAKEAFEACIRAAPRFDQAYLNLAQLYLVMREKERAREVLQSLLRLQPQHKLAQHQLEMLN